MHKFNGYDIELTRGDSLVFRISFSGRDLPEGSVGLFTVKAHPRDEQPVIQKRMDASGEQLMISLSPRDTDLTPRTYFWDVRVLIPLADGGYELETPMEYASFVILEAIGRDFGVAEDPGMDGDLPVLSLLIEQARQAIRDMENYTVPDQQVQGAVNRYFEQNTAEHVKSVVEEALQQAEASGAFNGPPGEKGDPGDAGSPGRDGFSPLVSVSEIEGGHRVSITDAQGVREIDVMNGAVAEVDGLYAPVIEVTSAGTVLSDASGGPASAAVTALAPKTADGAFAPSYNGGMFQQHETIRLNVNGISYVRLLPPGVYGGSFDWVSGRLVADAYRQSASDYAVRDSGTNSTGLKYIQLEVPQIARLIANNRYTRNDALPYADKSIRVKDLSVFIYDDTIDLSNPAAALEALEFLFRMETPAVYALQPQKIRLEKGENSVSSDAGETAVSYGIDTKVYIDNKFAALSAAVLGGA